MVIDVFYFIRRLPLQPAIFSIHLLLFSFLEYFQTTSIVPVAGLFSILAAPRMYSMFDLVPSISTALIVVSN